MIDIHCHILPGVDDGSPDLEESLEMARMAVHSGVTKLAATPHFPGREDALELLPEFRRTLAALQQALAAAGIPLTLQAGAEILCLPETRELAARHQLPTYAGTNHILTEFYFDESFGFMDRALSDLIACGYRPVIAHPERYDVIQQDTRRLDRWVRLGCLIQLNKGSLLGTFGRRPETAAHEILAQGLAHAIASDGHSAATRTPHMGQISRWAKEACTPECARILLRENPKRILAGRPPVGAE